MTNQSVAHPTRTVSPSRQPNPQRCRRKEPPHRLLATAVAAASLALIAGCTTDDPSPDPSSAPSASGGSSTDGGQPSPRPVMFTSATPADMPLEPYYAALRNEEALLGDALEAAVNQRFHDMEGEVAICMAEAGFEYQPMAEDPSAAAAQPSDVEASAQDSGWVWDRLQVPQLDATREEVAIQGYGVWDFFADEEEFDPNATVDPEDVHPNQRYVDSLSASARAAFFSALSGNPEMADTPWVWAYNLTMPGETHHCRGRADAKFPNPVQTDPLTDYSHRDLVGAMSDVQYTAKDDPRTLALDREWSACMDGRGYDVREEHVMGDSGVPGVISGPIQALYLAIRTGADGQVSSRDSFADTTVPEDQRTLIQSEPEKAVALADFDCRQETDYMARLIAIQRELETAFVESNRQALDQMLAVIEANIAEG